MIVQWTVVEGLAVRYWKYESLVALSQRACWRCCIIPWLSKHKWGSPAGIRGCWVSMRSSGGGGNFAARASKPIVVDKDRLTKELLSIGCQSSGCGVLGCGSMQRNIPLIIQIYLLSPGLWLHGKQGDAWVENELVPQYSFKCTHHLHTTTTQVLNSMRFLCRTRLFSASDHDGHHTQ